MIVQLNNNNSNYRKDKTTNNNNNDTNTNADKDKLYTCERQYQHEWIIIRSQSCKVLEGLGRVQGGLGRFALRNGTWPNPPTTFCSPVLSRCAPFSCLNARNRLLLMKIRPVSVILRWGLLPWRSTLLPIEVDNDLLRSERRNTESQMLQKKVPELCAVFTFIPFLCHDAYFSKMRNKILKIVAT